ncbi:7727_t:CDS:2 [Funneliformis mosseae]|uniref:7727_t:CDS:1 n=1 Tax=Funneliformis mosseae TaxID=27381 RepID=A0A9N9GS39_FUNMO|nr:7727_t:CDS:2 [Funneliformis mosseae]
MSINKNKLLNFNQAKSVLHGIVFCSFNAISIIKQPIWHNSIKKCQISDCALLQTYEDNWMNIVQIESTYLTLSSIIFEMTIIVLVFLLWKKKTWAVVKDFNITRNQHIKKMHATYQIQLVLVHAQIITTIFLAGSIWIMEILTAHIKIIAYGAEIKELWDNFFLAYFIFQFYILLIRSESHLLMGIVYVVVSLKFQQIIKGPSLKGKNVLLKYEKRDFDIWSSVDWSDIIMPILGSYSIYQLIAALFQENIGMKTREVRTNISLPSESYFDIRTWETFFESPN